MSNAHARKNNIKHNNTHLNMAYMAMEVASYTSMK